MSARLALALAIVFAALAPTHAQEYQGKTLVKARLVADTSAVVPGQPFQVGLLLEMAEGWHTYWESPGDAGLPTRIDWKLPEGFVAGPMEWPAPKRIIEPGDIHAFGYKGQVLLLTTITPPASLSESEIRMAATASWLVCMEICIPGSAEVELTLDVNNAATPANPELFEKFRKLLPLKTTPPFSLNWQEAADSVSLKVGGVPSMARIDLFVTSGGGVHPKVSRQGEDVNFTLDSKPPVRALLVLEDEGVVKSWVVESPTLAAAAPPSPTAFEAPAQPGLWLALLYGFLGGLILNLMPCVLPVISLKIFGFIRQAGDAPAKIFRHGLAFTAGIFAWFLGLGVVVLAIKAAGGQATWAFQFQNPWFNLVIAVVVFVFALNLFGVFEVVLPGRAAQAIDDTGGGEGYLPSFFQGVFATLLATPCTAPFLGTALGFAFSQPPAIILVMFASVAAGMAAPYLILSAKPAWLKLLPKPGAWMERLKQFMGFPLLATLIWLLFILGNQKGLEAVIWIAAFLLCLALALWIYGAFCGPVSKPRGRYISLALALLIAGWGTWYFGIVKFGASARSADSGQVPDKDGIPWVPFTQKALDDLLADNKAVFMDFTADWCISCKFNERTAIDRPAVRAALTAGGIVPMKADWTNSNPEITKALAAFGRVGVPFYIIYPAGRANEPIILPEILTEQIVLDAITKATQ
ncbi:MAG: protein-disulfide reductase DsbD domain-containing protein [Terrimicrobiaceae bacterium]